MTWAWWMLAGYAVAKLETVAATWRRQRRLTRETRREEAAKTRTLLDRRDAP